MISCLVIDTSPMIRKVAGLILSDYGFEVSEAASGNEGLARALLTSPQVVVVDWRLTDIAALDVLRKLRDSKINGSPYLFYCTTEFDLMLIKHGRSAGADDVLIKPFDRPSLLAKFNPLMETAGAMRVEQALHRPRIKTMHNAARI